jgi:hypothetical protein
MDEQEMYYQNIRYGISKKHSFKSYSKKLELRKKIEVSLNEISKTANKADLSLSACCFKVKYLLNIQVQMDRRQLDILIRILGTAVGKKYMFADHLG